MTIRVVLVDDQEMIRMGFRMVLESRPELEVVGEAADGRSALDLLAKVDCDIVLMDVRMPHMGGVEATQRIQALDPSPRVLILTTFDLDEYAYEALQAGASGFLLKDTPVEDIATAIEHVHNGDAVVAPSTTRRLLSHFVNSRPQPLLQNSHRVPEDVFVELTPREHDVLRLVAKGFSNGEIAEQLFLTEGTVKVHVGRILNKLDLRDRVQAVVLAYESGLIEIGD